MEINSLRSNRASQAQLHSSYSLKQRRSGYEPSDTETDWQESPHRDQIQENGIVLESPTLGLDLRRKTSPLGHSRRYSSRFDDYPSKKDSQISPTPRRHRSKSPYKTRKDDAAIVSPVSRRRNVNLKISDQGRQISPYKSRREEIDEYNDDEIVGSNRRKNQRTPTREERNAHLQVGEVDRVNERSACSRRSNTAPRTRTVEKEGDSSRSQGQQKGERTVSPLSRRTISKPKEREDSHTKDPSVGELDEMVANIKMSRGSMFTAPNFESVDSISPGDIFFSRDHTAMAMQQNGNKEANLYLKPAKVPTIETVLHLRSKSNGNVDHKPRGISTSSASRTTMTSNSGLSRLSSDKPSSESSKMSDVSGSTTVSMKKFTANRRKKQADNWFSCMRRGPCKTARSPEKQRLDEAAFIKKAFVVESLRELWADKHQPGSLHGFICHKQEAQLLSQLISTEGIPHVLFMGPSGSGKKALATALLGEIFGDACRNKTHDLRYFQVQEKPMTEVAVPITCSAHHVELNVRLDPHAKYALMGLVKEISNDYVVAPEVSNVGFKPDYKVMVLYGVDKAAESIQHLIKWTMDCYTDGCKLILCCEDDIGILETVKNRCKVIKVGAPVTHEITEVLIQIARKEDFELPMSFATKIAVKSKQNLRKAIMALEACKAHNYPFADDQPIPFGWEEVLIDLAAEILADPSPKRLFLVRGKFQKLLMDFVHPKLILLKLVEEFLKGVEANSKRELYYWHAYYEKRLPTGTTALLKLEEFVAKFMGIHRKSYGNRRYV